MVIRNSGMWCYIREVRKELPIVGKDRKIIVRQIESMCKTYFTERSSVSYDEIVKRLGSPQQIVASYIGEMDLSDVAKGMKIRNAIIRIISAAAVVSVIIWICAVSSAMIENRKQMNLTIEVETAVIERFEIAKGD